MFENEQLSIEYSEITPLYQQTLHYLFGSHLTTKAMRNRTRKFVEQDMYGWCALARNKENLSHKPESIRSYEVLFKKINEGYTYFKPSLSYTSQSYIKRNIRWITSLVLDFDRENLDKLGISHYDDLLNHLDEHGFSVSLIIATSTGYHVHLPIEATRGMWNGEQTIKRFDYVLKAIAEMVGSDLRSAESSHYFRIPKQDNIVYFKPSPKKSLEYYERLIQKSRIKKDEEKSFAQLNIEKRTYGKIMNQRAMQKLLNGEFTVQQYISNDKSIHVARNNACFTLALGFYQDKEDIQIAFNEIEKWYNRIDNTDFTWQEVVRSIKSAYSGKYHCVSSTIVYQLTGLKLIPVTAKKDRSERQDHFSEIQDDLIEYIKRNGNKIEISQRQLSNELNVSFDSLKKVIALMKELRLLTVEKIRKGRSFVSILILHIKESVHSANSYTLFSLLVCDLEPTYTSKKKNGNSNVIEFPNEPP